MGRFIQDQRRLRLKQWVMVLALAALLLVVKFIVEGVPKAY